MRRFLLPIVLLLLAGVVFHASAATGRVYKVLPTYVDLKGKHMLSPSLYDRDAYQAYLRQNPSKRSGIVFKVHYKAKGEATAPLVLRLEIKGVAKGDFPKTVVLEQSVKSGGWFGHWADLDLKGDAYKEVQEITAWRATLWEGETMLSEQKSFLW